MRRRAIFTLVAAAALVVSGCGGGQSDGENSAPKAAGYPVTVEGAAGPVVLKQRPAKIVSLSPTATEMLYAIGAGKQVTAVDELSNYPKRAPRTKLSGFKPNADAVAGYEPDLVVLSFDANKVVDGLKKLKIPVYVAPAAASLDDTYRQLTDLGKLTGHAEGAARVVKRMKSEISALVKDLPERAERLTYYYELDPQLHSVTSRTFVGSLLDLAKLNNIADEADKEGTGYPQLSAEHVIDSDPDLIFLADTKCCGQSADTVAKRAGWDRLSAVKQDRVIALDDDVASRWGPRVVDLLRAVTQAVAKAPA